jgi:hypothetical protein
MDIDKVLLTPEEIASIMFAENGNPTLRFEDSCKAQCLKLLKVLEDANELIHEHEGSTFGVIIHSPNCWLCKLKKDLGEE